MPMVFQLLPITSESEGIKIKSALESDKFNEFLKACRWSNFQIDYKMFKYFRKDFWKEFIKDETPEAPLAEE